MLRTRRESWRWLVLGLAMVVVALVMVALACGPSAPSGQAGGGAEARPTPTPTPTPEATATATPTPTPTADADSLSPEVNAVLALHAAAQGASGSSQSGPALPEKINLYISTKRNYNQPIQKFLKDNGATVIEGKEGPSGQHYLSKIEAIVPVSLIPALSRQPGFGFAFTDYARYDKLEYELSNLVMQYESGAITAEKAAARTSARSGDSGELVHIDVFYESCASIPGIVSFIKAETGLTPWWYAADEKCYGAGDYPFVDNVIPFSSLVRLSQQPGVQRIKLIIREPTGLNSDTPATGVPSLSSLNSVGQQVAGDAAEAHGADHWHDAASPVTGSGIKIGIIDNGFTGFSALTPGVDRPLLLNTVYPHCWGQDGTLSKTDFAACERASFHGTMVAESAYDIAPGAKFYISNASGISRTKQALIWMAENGVTVVNQSRPGTWEGTGNGLPYNDTHIHNLLHQAANGTLSSKVGVSGNKMLYVVSAGNHAERTWFSRKSNYSVNIGNHIEFQGLTTVMTWKCKAARK